MQINDIKGVLSNMFGSNVLSLRRRDPLDEPVVLRTMWHEDAHLDGQKVTALHVTHRLTTTRNSQNDFLSHQITPKSNGFDAEEYFQRLNYNLTDIFVQGADKHVRRIPAELVFVATPENPGNRKPYVAAYWNEGRPHNPPEKLKGGVQTPSVIEWNLKGGIHQIDLAPSLGHKAETHVEFLFPGQPLIEKLANAYNPAFLVDYINVAIADSANNPLPYAVLKPGRNLSLPNNARALALHPVQESKYDI